MMVEHRWQPSERLRRLALRRSVERVVPVRAIDIIEERLRTFLTPGQARNIRNLLYRSQDSDLSMDDIRKMLLECRQHGVSSVRHPKGMGVKIANDLYFAVLDWDDAHQP